MKDSINLPHGYTANILTDDSPENPFSLSFTDCATPILVFNLDRNSSRMESYKTGLCLRDVYWLIPARNFGPKGRVKILEAMDIEPEDASRELYCQPRKARAEDWQNAIGEILPADPTSWREAEKYFEMLELLCQLARIPCKWEQSTGYSQGDAAWVFVAAMPAWVKLTGWNPPKEEQQESLQADIDLWSAWAWGDVYGVTEILRPDSIEIPDSSCWGFYGDDHEKSGLLYHCRESVESDMAWLARESAAAHEAACRDIETTV